MSYTYMSEILVVALAGKDEQRVGMWVKDHQVAEAGEEHGL